MWMIIFRAQPPQQSYGESRVILKRDGEGSKTVEQEYHVLLKLNDLLILRERKIYLLQKMKRWNCFLKT